MAPHPDPYPMPLAEAMALPHSGRYRACDDTDSGDDDNDWSSRWAAYCSSISAAADGSIPTATGGFPAGSTFISAADSSGGGGGLGSVKPVVIIVPVLVGVALLILAIGGCVIWRKKRRDAAAARAGDAASVSSSAGLRGGALAMGEKVHHSFPLHWHRANGNSTTRTIRRRSRHATRIPQEIELSP
jgi:hypothetical protein